jgi:hypothetical protein
MAVESSITTHELLAAINAGTFRMVAGRKSETPKNTYVGIRFYVGSQEYRPWIDVYDVKATKDIADPNGDSNAKAKSGDDNNYQAKFETRVSAAGDLGTLMVKLNVVWKQFVADLITKGTIEQIKSEIRGLVVDKYSEDSKDKEKRGKFIDDPYLSFKYASTVNSPKHPYHDIRNRPSTVLYDYATKKTITDVKTGEVDEVYEEILMDDGKPLCEANYKTLYKKIDSSMVIKMGRIQMDSVVSGKLYISTPMVLQTGYFVKAKGNSLKIKPPPAQHETHEEHNEDNSDKKSVVQPNILTEDLAAKMTAFDI